MPVITVFNGLFCQAGNVVQRLLDASGYTLVTDQDVVAEAAVLSGMAEEKLARAFSAGTSIFNAFSHEKERAVAWLRLAMAKKLLEGDNLLFSGFASQLPADNIGHLLRVCLIASLKERLAVARKEEGYAEKHAQKLIRKADEDCADWVKMLRDVNDPWNESLYDIVLPVPRYGGGRVCGPDNGAGEQCGGTGFGEQPGRSAGFYAGRQGGDRSGGRRP